MPANEKRRYVMTSDLRQYIAEYTVANFWRYPIRRRVTYASALEWKIAIRRDGKSPDQTAISKFSVYFNQYQGYIETKQSKKMQR